jgi:hypothetical protein
MSGLAIDSTIRLGRTACLVIMPVLLWATAGVMAEPAPAPAGSDPLPRLLRISWHKGPSLPQGFQDSDGGIVRGTLVSVGGFCSGQKNVAGKESRYPRGFWKKVWGLDLRAKDAAWQGLPDLPGDGRQELFAMVVRDQLYCWGGFSYSKPYAYRDGYRLRRLPAGNWEWATLPELPFPLGGSGIAAIGTKIYVCGGCDYDAVVNDGTFFTQADRTGRVQRLGSRLIVIDTADLAAGWRELAACPGTPRWVAGMAAVQGRLYLLGGATGNDNPTRSYCTVVDNWSYDPGADRWEGLADLPVSSGNFPSGRIVFADRYILLVGGAQYGRILGPDGSVRPAYGRTTRHYKDNPYFSDIFVYDTRTGTFGSADPLPLNNNLPMAVVEGDRIHLVGGETGGCTIDGEVFGHHPDLYLVGRIAAVQAKQ